MPCFASFLSSGFEMFFGKAPKRIAVSKFDQAVQGMADIFFLLPSCRFYTETPKTVSRCMFSGRFWAFSFDISGFILAPVSFSVRHSKAAVCRFQVTKKRRIATTLLSCSEEAAPLLFINIKIPSPVLNDNLEQMAYDTYMHLFFKKQPNGKLREIIVENNKSSVQVGEAKGKSGNCPFFTSGDAILEWDCSMVDGRNSFLNTGGNAAVKFYIGEAAYSTDTWCITANRNLADYLYLLLLSIKPELNQKFFQGTGLKHLQKPLLKDRLIYIPSKNEIKGFNSKVQPLMNMISVNTRENKRLTTLRDWLLPMLINGQATVSD